MKSFKRVGERIEGEGDICRENEENERVYIYRL